ncbi:MAG TPA: hypothetical protein VL945_01285 [Candidatus Saccharimonadales bacterium]|nr:hypothetical protein [Candidatus Saccharimonadales bacterium]
MKDDKTTPAELKDKVKKFCGDRTIQKNGADEKEVSGRKAQGKKCGIC